MSESFAEMPSVSPQTARWRVVPATTFGLLGGGFSVASFAQMFGLLAGFSDPGDGQSSPAALVLGLLLMTAVGLIWIWAGRCWWRKKWIAAIFGTCLGYGLGVFAASHAWPELGPRDDAGLERPAE